MDEIAKQLADALSPLVECASGIDMYNGDPDNIDIVVTMDELMSAWAAITSYYELVHKQDREG